VRKKKLVNWSTVSERLPTFKHLLLGKKQRRKHSINRNFVGDYIGLDNRPALQAIVGRRERIEFAHSMTKIDRRFKVSFTLLFKLTRCYYLDYQSGRSCYFQILVYNWPCIGKKRCQQGKIDGSGQKVNLKIQSGLMCALRQIPYENIQTIGLSTLQDDYIFLQVKDDFTTLLESPLKTEMLTIMK
jgi:myosin-1